MRRGGEIGGGPCLGRIVVSLLYLYPPATNYVGDTVFQQSAEVKEELML
jgi:hypothetical protein